QLGVAAGLADVLDAAAKQRPHLIVEVGALGRLAHLGGDAQRHAGGARDAGGVGDALVGRHAAEEQGVAAVAAAEGEGFDVDAVVDDGGDAGVDGGGGVVGGDGDDGDVVGHRSVQRAEVAVEWAVVGGHHSQAVE